MNEQRSSSLQRELPAHRDCDTPRVPAGLPGTRQTRLAGWLKEEPICCFMCPLPLSSGDQEACESGARGLFPWCGQGGAPPTREQKTGPQSRRAFLDLTHTISFSPHSNLAS